MADWIAAKANCQYGVPYFGMEKAVPFPVAETSLSETPEERRARELATAIEMLVSNKPY